MPAGRAVSGRDAEALLSDRPAGSGDITDAARARPADTRHRPPDRGQMAAAPPGPAGPGAAGSVPQQTAGGLVSGGPVAGGLIAGGLAAGVPPGVALVGGGRPSVSFDRRELDTILRLYGRMVAAGEWRDYALDFGREEAVFSVFRRASEMPLYRIVKAPKLARRQGAYSVMAPGGRILKRGSDLARVLQVLEPKTAFRLVD